MPQMYVCPGCKTRRNCHSRVVKHRLCAQCTHDFQYGLFGGEWVVRRGVRVWVEDDYAETGAA